MVTTIAHAPSPLPEIWACRVQWGENQPQCWRRAPQVQGKRPKSGIAVATSSSPGTLTGPIPGPVQRRARPGQLGGACWWSGGAATPGCRSHCSSVGEGSAVCRWEQEKLWTRLVGSAVVVRHGGIWLDDSVR